MTVVAHLRTRVPDARAKAMKGAHCTPNDAGLLLNGDANVYKPDGGLLIALRRGLVPMKAGENAYEALHSLQSTKSTNRGIYSASKRYRLYGGKETKNTYSDPVSTNAIGYFDRQGGRSPYCRATEFTAKEVARWETILPIAAMVSSAFQDVVPDRFRKQLEICNKTRPEWVIPKTVFTTLTVNNNVVAGVHTDAGDYKPGFGCMSVVRRGYYEGAWLCFPQYRVGVDLQDGDCIFFDPHELHGMTPFSHQSDDAERISMVHYYRAKMVDCGSVEEEIANAKKVRGAIK